jgi:hypothetical protein
MKRLTTQQFIKKAKKVHGDKYDYSKVEYTNSQTKVCIICPEHGEFWQTPNNHLKKNGCPSCGKLTQNKSETKTTENFIKESTIIHNNKYDYSKTIYEGALKKVCIICPEHGEFWQTPTSHLHGCGCKKCKGFGLTNDEWIEKAKKIHGNKYNYSKTKYNGAYSKVCIICPEHGEFWQFPNNHLNGAGCPNCRNYKLENEIKILLEKKHINFEQHKHFKWLKNKNSYKTLDFYLPDYSVIIECQGIQHFEPTDFAGKGKEWATQKYNETKETDNLKLNLCKEHGLTMFYYSNLNIDFPYKVYTDKNKLINTITKNGKNVDC